ncbi:MAG: hypothetical protein Q4E22_05075 [Coriobacteriia bacterium]|nr:hypothetical protein [Coriobacteriia bacterium]
MSDYHIGIIDIGTVSTRLSVTQVQDESITQILKKSRITDLGQGRFVSSSLTSEAIERTVAVVNEYIAQLKTFEHIDFVVTTLTSAARYVDNIDELLDKLLALGLKPQVISGDIEARLGFLGVCTDFSDERIMVLDIGGGSTEISVGEYNPNNDEGMYNLEFVRSYDIGCRRASELFMRNDPPEYEEIDAARAWISEEVGSTLSEIERPDRLVAVGGTATSLVAVDNKLDPYDSSFVHLSVLSGGQVADMIDRFAALSLEERSQLPGLQVKRAPVILPGAIILEMIMAFTGFSEVTISESDMLAGLARFVAMQVDQKEKPFEWEVEVSQII